MDKPTIFNIENQTECFSVLFNRIFDAIGDLRKPKQIVNEARAYAEAEIIQAQGEAVVQEIKQRAATRLLYEEVERQKNIEQIIMKSIEGVDPTSSKPQDMQKDWLVDFFEKCRIVSDDDMQTLWAKILSGEANKPGSFSKRTVSVTSLLDKVEAELFTSLCRFVWTFDGLAYPLIFNDHWPYFTGKNLNTIKLDMLETAGLIIYKTGGYMRTIDQRKIKASYYGRNFDVDLQRCKEGRYSMGFIFFTQAGRELFSICESKPEEDFIDLVINTFSGRNIIFTPA